MAITFKVDEVAEVTSTPPTHALREHLGEVMAFGGDGECRVLVCSGAIHSFLGCAGRVSNT